MRIHLRDLKARLTTINERQGGVLPGVGQAALVFRCPICRNHSCVVPYGPVQKPAPPLGRHTWKHVSGDTIDNITLTPSYRIMTGCKLHGFVRNGHWEGC